MPETSAGSFGGLPLADAVEHSWELRSGVSPSVSRLVFHESLRGRVIGKLGIENALVLQRAEGTTVTVARLTAIREIPVSKPMHLAVLVADLRYLWPSRLHVRSYNITRRSGNKYIVGGSVVELQQSIDQYGYAPFSEKDRTKRWTAEQVLGDVLASVCRDKAKVVVDSLPVNNGVTDRMVTVQDLDLCDSGDQAVARALRLVPGADVFVDETGVVHVYDGTDQSVTARRLKSAGPATVAGGIARLINLSALRPRKIRVFFEREVELRLDTVEETENAGYATPSRGVPDLKSYNVMPLPDITLTFGGKTYGTGSWVDFRDVIPAWNSDLAALGEVGSLTLEKIRKRWFTLEGFYSPLGNLTLSAALRLWAARCGAIKIHYRRTYRVPPGWMAVIRDLKDWRVGILDPVTMTRGFATAWSEFCIVPSEKWRIVYAGDKTKQAYWINVEGYPGYTGELHEEAAAPAVVRMVDAQVGIYTIDYRTDPQGLRELIHPSCMRNAAGELVAPTRDLSDALGPFGPNWVVKGAAPIGLSDQFGAAVVLTALAGAPNSSARLHYIDVTPEDLGDAFVKGFSITGGTGPTWEIYCPASIMTAWLAWRDSSAARETAARLFGLSGATADEADGKGQGGGGETKYPGYEVVNEKALLPAVARAIAALKYAEFADAWEGEQAATLRPELRPGGNVEAVMHTIGTDGRASTRLAMPAARRPLDFLALVPQSLRPKILGLIDDGKKA